MNRAKNKLPESTPPKMGCALRNAGHPAEQSDTTIRKYEPGSSSQDCQNQVFRNELPQQAAFACT